MHWPQRLATEFAITLSDGSVWLSIGQGLLFGAICLLFGVWVARLVGLLPSAAPAGETLGVGLASGLLVVAALWAAIASGGSSSFTPVAVGFVIAIGLAVARRWQSRASEVAKPFVVTPPVARHRGLILAVAGGAAFVVAVALLYGSTLTLSPRDGVQPVEFGDEAYYSVLSADLKATGTESLYSPSGFSEIDGLPGQTWYHWGEAWLGASLITVFAMAPLDARHFVVLPLMLLAAAALTGTVVRRVTGSATRGAFLIGFLVCLFLAPVSIIPGPHFSAWAVGLIFGITLYGLAAVAVLLAMYGLAILGRREASWPLAIFVASAAALIIPAHVVIGLLALVGVGSVGAIWIADSLGATRRLPVATPVWRRTCVATGIAILATVAWALLTGHGIGTSGSSQSVSSFNASWREAVAITTACSGSLLAIVVAWFMVRRQAPTEAGLYVGTGVLLVTGAIVWGSMLGDFTTFHAFFGGIAVFATPVAAVAVWRVWLRLRAIGRGRLAVAVLLLCAVQSEIGIGLALGRLVTFGPGGLPPIPLEILDAIRGLPADAKVAYACQPFEEAAFWDARFLGVDARTGRRVVPMCFEAETFVAMTGAVPAADVPSPLFQWAPQREIYPDSGAHPSPARVAAFLKDNGIDYIYADTLHPNTLFPDAIPIATEDDTQVLRLP